MIGKNIGYFGSTITASLDEQSDILGFSVFPGAGENVGSYYAGDDGVIIPTLYLSQDIKITGGTGTKSDPYEISL